MNDNHTKDAVFVALLLLFIRAMLVIATAATIAMFVAAMVAACGADARVSAGGTTCQRGAP